MSPPPSDHDPLRGNSSSTWSPEGPLADDAAAPLPGRAEDRFELLERIGLGSMGEVWRARDLDLGRTVALKIMRTELGDRYAGRFLTEARATALLEHPGVVPVHEVGRLADGRPYYSMQEIRGTTMRQRIAELHAASAEGPWTATNAGWTLRRLVEVFHTVCDTVAFAHARGVIHRDLKPENVMLGDFGEVFVVDWGLVKVVGTTENPTAPAETVQHTGTQVGQAAGTRGYMPPEQAQGRVEDLGPPADVYALGGVLYCLLTGHAPATPPEPSALDHPRVPPDLAELCREAMDPVATRRPPDGRTMARRVRTWLDRTAAAAEQEAHFGRAETALRGTDDRTRHALREALLELVDADGHSRPRPAEDIEPDALAALVRADMVIVEGGRARLADPALEEWPRLRSWVAADREGQQLRQELAVAARGWDERGRRRSDLWEPGQLDTLRRWLDRRQPWMTEREQAFVAASIANAHRGERARRLARLGALLALSLVALVTTGLWRQATDARERERDALSAAEMRAFSAEAARTRLEQQAHAAMILEAAVDALSNGRAALPPPLAPEIGALWVADALPGAEVRYSPDGRRVAALAPGGDLRIHDERGGVVFTASGVLDMAWGPQGHTLAVLTSDHLGMVEDDALASVASTVAQRVSWTPGGNSLLVATAEELVVYAMDGRERERRTRYRGGRTMLGPLMQVETWLDDGLRARRLDGDEEAVVPVSAEDASMTGFSTDLDRAWVGDAVGTVTLYDRHGARLRTSPGHGRPVGAATASPAADLLAVGGYDAEVRVLDLATGTTVVTQRDHDRAVWAVAWHPSGRVVASGGDDDFVSVWDARTGRVLQRLQGLPRPVSSLAFSPDGHELAITAGTHLYRWAPAGLPERELSTCEGTEAWLDTAQDLLIRQGGAAPCTTDLRTGRSRAWPGLQHLAPLGDQLLGVAEDQLVRVDPRSGQEEPIAEADGAVWAWMLDDVLVTLDRQGRVTRRDADGTLLGTTHIPDWTGLPRVRPDSPWLASVGRLGDLVVTNLRTGESPLRVPGLQVSALGQAWWMDEGHAIVGDGRGVVRRFDLSRPEDAPELLIENLGTTPVTAVTAARGLLAVGDADGRIRLRDADGSLRERLLDTEDAAARLVFSPDGDFLAVGTQGATIEVLRTADLATVLRIRRADRSPVHHLAWRDDDELVAVGPTEAHHWLVPSTAPSALELTNLRVCRERLSLVAMDAPPYETPWAGPPECPEADTD